MTDNQEILNNVEKTEEDNKMHWILNCDYNYEYDESDYYDYEELFENWEEEED